MLRNEENEASARSCGAPHPLERRTVVVQVLEKAERADDVELELVLEFEDVQVCEVGLRDALPGDRQTLLVGLEAGEARGGIRGMDARQHVAGTASDLEEASRLGEIASEDVHDEMRSRAVPEASRLARGEKLEEPGVVVRLAHR